MCQILGKISFCHVNTLKKKVLEQKGFQELFGQFGTHKSRYIINPILRGVGERGPMRGLELIM